MKYYQYIFPILLLFSNYSLRAESLLRIVKSGDITKLQMILDRGHKVNFIGSKEIIDFNKVYDDSYDLLSYCIKQKPKNADLMIKALIDYAKKEKQYNPHYNHILLALQHGLDEQAQELLDLLLMSEFPGVKREHKDRYVLRLLTDENQSLLIRGENGKRFIDKVLTYGDQDNPVYQKAITILQHIANNEKQQCKNKLEDDSVPHSPRFHFANETLRFLKPDEHSCSSKLQQYWKNKDNKEFFKQAGIQLGHLNYDSLQFCETLVDENLIAIQMPHYLKKGVKYYYSAQTEANELCRYYGFWSAVPEHVMNESWQHISSANHEKLAYLRSSRQQPYLVDGEEDGRGVDYIHHLYCRLYPSEQEKQDVLLSRSKVKKD